MKSEFFFYYLLTKQIWLFFISSMLYKSKSIPLKCLINIEFMRDNKIILFNIKLPYIREPCPALIHFTIRLFNAIAKNVVSTIFPANI